MIKTAIFDLDGTLLNTLEDLKDSTNYALEQFGFPTRTLEEVRKFVGNGVRKLIERAVPTDCDAETTEKCLAIFKQHYSKNMYNHTKPYNSILEILKELSHKGLKIAVVSNKFDSAVKELCEKYFTNLVDVAILNAEKSTSVYIGDSEVDVATAQNADLPCIGVTWGFRDKKDLIGAKYIIDNPLELIETIGRM